ncbi:hypothetical protein SY89_03264 [Halolamina pelagica]|uniref:Uncharacterized protein n=2 Tax=Halolamina pelagica TaxID=699431 RepID=A0A0P7GKP2_9EURY|nr:hypothetical protein SY89_03264 [Halolamina pelagica]
MRGYSHLDALRGVLSRYYLLGLTSPSGFFLPVAIHILHHEGFGHHSIGLGYAVTKLVVEAPTIIDTVPQSEQCSESARQRSDERRTRRRGNHSITNPPR